MIEAIAAAIIGGAAVFGTVFAYGRIEYWRGLYDASVEDYNRALYKITDAERTTQAISDKYFAVMDVVKQFGDRPVVAALKDEQISQIISALSQIASSNHPSRLN